MSRVYLGHLPARCRERDIEDFFKGYGRLRDVVLKNGYGFVEFDDEKDADDAVYDLHGRELRGERIIVEHARLPPGSRGGSRRTGGRDRRYGPPTRTEYRVVIENLSSRVSWQDLKDMMRKAGDVTYADAHKSARNDGIVEFSSYADMKEAIEKFDGYELYGRRLRVYEDRPNRHSRSGSRGRSRSDSIGRKRAARSRSRESYRRPKAHSPRRRRERSVSSKRRRSVSRDGRDSSRRSKELSVEHRSRSPSHRSESHHSRKRSASHHTEKNSPMAESRSPSRNGTDGSIKNESEIRSRSRTRSRSASASRSRSRSRSADSRSPDRSRSVSRSRSGSRRSVSAERHQSDEEEMDSSRRSDDERDETGRESED
ncbi:unnamed protein product [Dicrocoelium dendriticum]|nr:unnamed protein product [Dicrocoelium dendriticum]